MDYGFEKAGMSFWAKKKTKQNPKTKQKKGKKKNIYIF